MTDLNMGMRREESVVEAMFGYCLLQFISYVSLFSKPSINQSI